MESVGLLLTSLVVISFVFAAANFLAWRLFDRPDHALIWSVAYWLAGVQYGLNLGRSFLPSEQAFWILANVVSFMVVSFAVWGHRRRLQLRLSLSQKFGSVVFLAAVLVAAVLLSSAPGFRAALSPAFACAGMCYISFILIRYRRQPMLAQYSAAVIYLLFAATQGVAATIALGFGEVITPVMVTSYNLANFALMPSLFVAMGVAVLLLMATDLSNRLTELALTDSLTGVSNRRGFMELGHALVARTQRHEAPLTLVLCDIDYFKRINDGYGHATGDKALEHFAAALLGSVRAEDAVGRLGGEEFALALSGMDGAQSHSIATRIRQQLADHPLATAKGPLPVKACFGVAQWREGDSISDLLQRADVALYSAKASGRDAIALAPHSATDIAIPA